MATASCSPEPSPEELVKMLAPIAEAIQSIQRFRESNRASDHFNHLSAVSDSIPALGWVTIVSMLLNLINKFD